MSSEEKKEGVPATVAPVALSVKELTDRRQLVITAMREVMREGEHYGRIRGVNKRFLFQAGADVINVLFQLNPEFEVVSAARRENFVGYVVHCVLRHIGTDRKVATGLGACNSRERKYVNQKVDPWDLENTILKMASKRAKVAASINASACTDIFTQDPEALNGEAEKPQGIRPAESYTVKEEPQGGLEEGLSFGQGVDERKRELIEARKRLMTAGGKPHEVCPELKGQTIGQICTQSNVVVDAIRRLTEAAERLEGGVLSEEEESF